MAYASQPKRNRFSFSAISEFPKWRKYLISLSFRDKSSVRPVQVGGFEANIVVHRSTAVRGRGGPPPPWESSCRTRTGPVEADGTVDAQNAPTAPWKTLRVFHELPQGLSHRITHAKPRKAPKWRWETRIDPVFRRSDPPSRPAGRPQAVAPGTGGRSRESRSRPAETAPPPGAGGARGSDRGQKSEPRVAKLEQLEHGGSRKVLDEPQTAHPAEAGCGQTAEMIERVRTLHLQPSLAGRRDAGDVGIDATSGDAVVAQLRQQLAAAAAEVHHAVIARAIVGARVQAVLQDRNVVPGLPLALLVRRTEATKKPHVVSIKTAIIARRDQRVPRRPFGLEDRQPLLASATLVAQGFNLFRRGDEGLSCAVGSSVDLVPVGRKLSRRGDQGLSRAVGPSVDLVPVGLKLRLQIWPNQPTHEFLVGNDGGPNPPAMRLYRGFGGTRPLHPSILSLPPSVGQAAAQSARAPAATLIVHDTLGGVGP